MKVYTLIQQWHTTSEGENKIWRNFNIGIFFLECNIQLMQITNNQMFLFVLLLFMLTQFFSQVTVYYIDHRGKKLAQCKWFLVRFFSLFFELALITFIWIFLVLEFESNSLIRQNILNNIFVTIV